MNVYNAENKYNSSNPFPIMEKEVLEFWDEAKIFERSVEKDAPKGDYVFYDGPPFATGLPHYGHLVASIMKDAVPRFFTMKGYRVERRWGWDCHGLPVENLAEKELGLKNREDIEGMGVAKFNEYCRSIVLRYVNEWKEIIRRIGRWVDMENDYKTMDASFMESIWWVFKKLWDKGLIYKGYKSMHICPRCGTTLSNFEVTQNYQEMTDISVIVKFKLADPGEIKVNLNNENVYILAWTTTPWTLVGNVALAISDTIKYVLIKCEEEYFILAKDRLEDTCQGVKYEIIKEVKGKEFVGLKYEPIFNYYAIDEKLENRENGWKIYAADFVTTEEGTGVVHIAPAFGEADMDLGKKFNLPFIQHVDLSGKFKPEVTDWAGVLVKPKGDPQATDKKIVEWLNENKKLFVTKEYTHSYPLCWRCDTPLLNYAADSWFVKVTDIKSDLVKNNQAINWVPDHIKDGRFGKWLEQARDWAISRNRYWGTPLPVWICDKCGLIEVIASLEDIESRGAQLEDLHKHFVDKITWRCKCGGTMKRIPEVLDCWFESGSMPYAQVHYLGQPLSKFDPEKGLNFPAQFIAEGVDQTRGWFYTLAVLGTAMFDRFPFKHVIANGIVLAEDGQKMSKRLRNYPDPMEIFEKYSVDAVRFYLLSSPVLLAENLNFSEKGVQEILRKVEIVLWNVYKFYEIYDDKSKISARGGSASGGKNQKSKVETDNILDSWISVRLNQLIVEVTENMDGYNLPRATRPVADFINDLSTWYIRRSRDRFKGEDEKDKEAALQTTYHALREFSKVIAPFMPFIAEQIWQKVTGYNFEDENKSVHLEEWPKAAFGIRHSEFGIIENMEIVRRIVELGLAERDKAGIKVRQPLSELRITNYELRNEYEDLVKDELNVKSIICKSGKGDILVELNTVITDDLKLEGIKRDLVRQINMLRKEAGLTIADRIELLRSSASEMIMEVFEKMGDEIKKDTLADKISEGVGENGKEVKINGEILILSIKKI